jgi:hypothetical protein
MGRGLIDLLNLPTETDIEEKKSVKKPKTSFIQDYVKCSPSCPCLNTANFYCEWNQIYNPQKNIKPIQVIIPGSYHTKDNEMKIMERHYISILTTIISNESANTLIDHILSKDNPERTTIYDFFNNIDSGSKFLKKYMTRKQVKNLKFQIHELKNRKNPPYIYLGDDCPYKSPPEKTLKEYLREKFQDITRKVRDMY